MTRIGVSEVQEAAWAHVQTLGEFTVPDLSRYGISSGTARKYCRRWHREGRIRITDRMVDRARVYAVIENPVLDRNGLPTKPSIEGNMWRSMRQLAEFSPTDIAAHSNVGIVSVDLKTAQAYCRDLLKAGYLHVRRKARPGARQAIYRLIRDTGPAAPARRRVSGVYDPNTEEFIPNMAEATWRR